MNRQIITGLITLSLWGAQVVNVPIAFADNHQTSQSTEQTEENSFQSSEQLSLENSLSDSVVSVTESFEEIIAEKTDKSSSTVVNQLTETSNEASSEEIKERETPEKLVEDVYYNNQWFKFPIQPDVNESEKNLNDNHQLGAFTKSEGNMQSKVDKITELQIGRPSWDFIDVSSHQGELSVADYEYMKKYGVTGVVVKLTEGTFYTNPFAKNQILNAQKAGLKVSTYHFSRYTTKIGALSEADYYAEAASRLSLPLNTIMVNDIEKGLNEYSTQNSIFFANRLKELGYEKIVHYSSASAFSEDKLSISMLGELSLWIAQYPYEPTDKNILHNTKSAWQWSDSMTFTDIQGKTFDVSMDHTGLFSNSVVKEPQIDEKVAISSEKDINKYGTVTLKNFTFWEDLNFEKEKGISNDYLQQTLFVEKEVTLIDGSKFLLIKDNKGNDLGYIDTVSIKISNENQGVYQSYGKYVSIKGNYNIWDSFEWKSSKLGVTYQNKTYQARGVYHHFNGSRYLSLYDSQDKWLGYINEDGTTLAPGDQGIYQNYGKYVSIKGSYDLWNGFDWKNKTPGSRYQNKTYQARGVYHHFNGSRYLSLYDSQGKWLGYINEDGTTLAPGDQGIYQNYGKYVSIKGNYNIWESFAWENSKSGMSYKNQTFQARGVYYHFNGSRYLSLYDNKGIWLGYINESGTTLGNGNQGAYQNYGKYVSVKGSYNIWNGFAWEKNTPGSKYKNQTLQAKGVYHHFNGSRYLSLYDNKGKWLGYMNEAGATVAAGAQGTYQKYDKYVTVKSENYAIWRNFSWSSKAPGKFSDKTFLAKGVYNHFNGSRYLSLYDSQGGWIGYINEKGTKPGKSQAEKFKKVQELLNKDYKSKNFGIYVTSLVDGSVAQINGTQQFHAASTGKLPVLYYTQKMILEKKINGDQPYVYTDAINKMPNSYMRGGAGILQGQPYGKKFSLNTMMNWTAKYSDNQGTNFLAYYAANKYDAKMKQEISKIIGRDWKSPFYVNAKDNAKMLEAIYHQGGKLITDLSNTMYDDQRIPKYLPVQVAHKIGDVNDLRHDAGIVYTKEPYTLSVLTKNYQSYEQISILSKKIYDILK